MQTNAYVDPEAYRYHYSVMLQRDKVRPFG